MAGIFVGVMALIVVISVMAGFQEHLKEKFLGINAHIIVKNYKGNFKDSPYLRNKILSVNVSSDALLSPLYDLFSTGRKNAYGNKAGVKAITPMCFIQGLLSSKGGMSGAVIRGIDPETIRGVLNPGNIVFGKELRQLRHGEIIVGKELLRSIRASVGDTIEIALPSGVPTPFGMIPKIRAYKVVGEISSGMYDYDASCAFITIKDAQMLIGLKDNIHAYEIRITDPDYSDMLAVKIREALSYPYWTMDWKGMSKSLFSALRLEKAAMFVVLTLIVMVAAFNIVSALVMLVMEKREDIAILKAMGATDGQILRIFIYTGTTIGIIGTVLGVIGGVGLCMFLSRYPLIKIPKEVYFTDTLPILLDPKDVVIIAISALFLSFIATIYPAKQASRVSPSEALRIG